MTTNNTRRYPRTLNEAFGPYSTWHVAPRKPSFFVRHAWWLVLVVFFFTVGASLAVQLS